MNNRIASIFALAALSAAGPVSAQSASLWEEFGSGDGLTVSYNPLTVRHNDGVVTFLEKVSYATPATLPNGQRVAYYTVDMTINCAANTYSHANFTTYAADGAVIPGVNDPTPAGMNAIPPGTPPAAFRTKFCT